MLLRFIIYKIKVGKLVYVCDGIRRNINNTILGELERVLTKVSEFLVDQNIRSIV